MKHSKRILIYRLGSLGDTIVALPALHLIAKAFPDSERWMLTNFSISAKAAPIQEVLVGTGLVDDYLEYPVGTRDLHVLLKLRIQIRQFRPNALIYLTESRGFLNTLRDALFFKMCGIPKLIGIPYSKALRICQSAGNDLYEYEGARLVRCIHELGDVQMDGLANYDLALSQIECGAAQAVIAEFGRTASLLAVSLGTKVDVNDWGDSNWSKLLTVLSAKLPGWKLVVLGAKIEFERSEALRNAWKGDSLNLCGKLTVRESAAVIEKCRMFMGHDSGPMHLAAAVGTPCVAIFSARNLPGVWFPYGSQHRVIYHSVECRNCRLEICEKYQKKCITSISVREVTDAVLALTNETIPSAE